MAVHNDSDDDRYYSSGRDNDDSPILSHRHEKQRRSGVSLATRCFLLSVAVIVVCVLMYIPMYYRADIQPRVVVGGWGLNTPRDTALYVRPHKLTARIQPHIVCAEESPPLLLLIVVCSSTTHFERRLAIRQTWGDYNHYLQISTIYNTVREKYKNYNYTYDLDTDTNKTGRWKRDISGFGQLIPELAKALQSKADVKTDRVKEVEEKRFDDEDVLREFDMDKELGGRTEQEPAYDYEYESNVMRIPPRGLEESPNLDQVLKLLKRAKAFTKPADPTPEKFSQKDFMLVFLLGLGPENDTELQRRIEIEAEQYGDVIQEDFRDTYNNLTLKSIMMLKWINNMCNHTVRYILKTDDDMYINVPALVDNVRSRSLEYSKKLEGGAKEEEVVLAGDLICGARPVLDHTNKWYSPRYMFEGAVYPRYVSGTGYLLTVATARALYNAALHTPYFHLEDVYITGMCAMRAGVPPTDDPMFSYVAEGGGGEACHAHAHVTTHRVAHDDMRVLHAELLHTRVHDRCERQRLTQVRRLRLRTKRPLTIAPEPRGFPRHAN